MRTLRRVVAHLGLRPMREAELRAARALAPSDEGARVRAAHGLPDAPTATAVRAFYEPFNRALAAQLDDRSFLWRDVDGWTT